MARRLYLGSRSINFVSSEHRSHQFVGLPADTRSDDVSKYFEGYGHIVDCRVMTGELTFPSAGLS
jgi:RNA recognition motif-containing protein